MGRLRNAVRGKRDITNLGAWDSGFQEYTLGRSGLAPVRVPTSGYFVPAGYILAGETIRDRTLIDPRDEVDSSVF
jgi:phosphate-selective porin OprO/OprP